jgi:hypothetical protein
MKITTVRSRLSFLALMALVGFGVLAFVYGGQLNSSQIAVLSVIVGAIVKDVGAAFSYFFDGTPEKPATPDPKDPPA